MHANVVYLRPGGQRQHERGDARLSRAGAGRAKGTLAAYAPGGARAHAHEPRAATSHDRTIASPCWPVPDEPGLNSRGRMRRENSHRPRARLLAWDIDPDERAVTLEFPTEVACAHRRWAGRGPSRRSRQ
jgi:hypothetical protein